MGKGGMHSDNLEWITRAIRGIFLASNSTSKPVASGGVASGVDEHLLSELLG